MALNFIHEQGQSTEDNLTRLLEDFLQLKDEEASSAVVARLIFEYAKPVMMGILNYKFRALRALHNYSALQEIEDIQNDSILHLIAQLNRYKENPTKYPVTDFRGLVATLTYRAYADFFRKRNPRRNSLVLRLKHILRHTPGLAFWKEEDRLLCGKSVWQHRPPTVSRRSQELLQTAASAAADKFGASDLKSLLTLIFERVTNPVPLDDLVTAVAQALGINDSTTAITDEDEEIFPLQANPPDPLLALDRQTQVEKLWGEILELPLRQRKSLLLNFDRKENALALFLIADCASIEEIAVALEMTLEELSAIWDQLPWEDARIAEHLGLTRQQVINLRKSARERLQRRLKEFLDKS